jgi:AcrR family transcriptional regulator
MSKSGTINQRMSRPNDARALRSREALKAALLSLVEERPFDQVSIRDITNRAGVSYPVFFRRYASREQLLEDIATEEVRRLLSLTSPIFDANRQDESARALCAYVSDHRQLWSQLLTGGAAPIMRDEFKRIAREIGGTREPTNPWLPADLAAAFVVSGLFEILAWWLSQPEDYPTEKVVRIIDILIVRLSSTPLD